jgi:hypothetical protein
VVQLQHPPHDPQLSKDPVGLAKAQTLLPTNGFKGLSIKQVPVFASEIEISGTQYIPFNHCRNYLRFTLAGLENKPNTNNEQYEMINLGNLTKKLKKICEKNSKSLAEHRDEFSVQCSS